MATGGGRRRPGTFEPAGGWAGDRHDGVPIFVLSRREPDSEMGQWPLVTYTYVNDRCSSRQGRRLFDKLRPEHIELERPRILKGEAGVSPTCTDRRPRKARPGVHVRALHPAATVW